MANYLLYGENELEKKDFLNKIKNKFKKQNEALNIETVDLMDKEDGLVELKTKIKTPSLLAQSRLITVENLVKALKEAPADLADSFFDCVKSLASNTTLVSVEGEIESKKWLNKFKKNDFRVKEFKAAYGYKLTNWLQKRASKYNLNIGSREAKMLCQRGGSNSQKLDGELKKLRDYLAFKGEKQISEEDIKVLVSPDPEVVIFDFLDAVAQKNYGEAGGMLEEMLKGGVSEVYLIVMLDRTLTQLIMAKDLKERKSSLSSNELAKEFGWHPFVAKKISRQIDYFNKKDLIKIYQNLFDLEIKVKTGQVSGQLQLTRFLGKL